MSLQYQTKVPLLFVRFEQARGLGGVPKTWVPYLSESTKVPEIGTLVRMAVQLLRAQCADPVTGHGKDLLPGRDDEYRLHNIDGGVIKSTGEIRWETVDGANRAEVVLTWRDPASLLASGVET